MDHIRTITLLAFSLVGMLVVALAQPTTPSELGWPHPNPNAGNTNLPPPCAVFANPMSLVVVTNTVTPFILDGGNGNFLITISPTKGTISGFSTVTGAGTYNENNGAATSDFFEYWASNSVTCIASNGVNISIGTLSNLSCGECFSIPPQNGGVVTGNIYFNTGFPNEEVCIYYTNATCNLATNCGMTDANGNVQFFVHFCPGTSNFCVQSLQVECTNMCYFTHVNVQGSGQGAGDYYFRAITQFVPTFQVTFTNTINGNLMLYAPSGDAGFDDGQGCFATMPVNYMFIENAFGHPYYFATNNPGNVCNSSSGFITGWYNTPCGASPSPTLVTWDGEVTITNCTPVCP